MPSSQANELLSICIPTRNRAPYLRSLLSNLARQMQAAGLRRNDITVYISDNGSADETPEVCREFQTALPGFVYSRHPKNIGGDENIFHVRTLGKGRFIWVLGDDELVDEQALARLVPLLLETAPGLVLALNGNYNLPVPPPQTFADYRAFALACMQVNVHALAEPTLVSSNIVRADCFDFAYGEKNLSTHYAHLYGMIPTLQRQKAPVVLPDFKIVAVRKHSPPPCADDGPNLGAAWINLDAAWINYFTWLREVLDLPGLDPLTPSRVARQIMKKRILQHPLDYLWVHRRELLQPIAWKFALQRFFGKR